MSIISQIEQTYHLTERAAPTVLHGGYLHQMYKLETEQGDFALKLLNPHIMQRDTAAANYAQAERLEQILEDAGLPILPALIIHSRKMQELDGAYFYLFPYYDGKSIKGSDIGEEHCRKIGTVLAQIHNLDRKPTEICQEPLTFDWDAELGALQAFLPTLYEKIAPDRALLYACQERANRAAETLPAVSAICHNDLDPKNVLWRRSDFRIIDLECLSYENPFRELMEMALSWSGFEEHGIRFPLFEAFLDSYAAAGGELPTDWAALYDCTHGRLGWIAYNLKRAQGIDCSTEEQVLGQAQVKESILHLRYHAEMREQILSHCP